MGNALARCARLLPQACAGLLKQYDLAFGEAASLQHRTGVSLLDHGCYEEAERYLQQALQIDQQMLPTAHPDTIIALQRYAHLLRQVGRVLKKLSTHAFSVGCPGADILTWMPTLRNRLT